MLMLEERILSFDGLCNSLHTTARAERACLAIFASLTLRPADCEVLQPPLHRLLEISADPMDGAFDIPDSTDWLNTPLRDFSTLENALHCQICKEFYDTPMITSCSHTFCSKCIRTCLSTDGKCPACRAADQASKLRNNWALQEVVAAFLAARPTALHVARKEKEQSEEAAKRPGKRKRAVLDAHADDVVEVENDVRTTRSKSRRVAASQNSQTEPIEIDDTDGDDDFEPGSVPGDGLVDCPLGCGKRMKIQAVDPHLDRCEDEKKQGSRANSRTPVNGIGSSRPITSQSIKPQEKTNELNYSLLTETKLRQKLNELGIPSWGSKSLMIKRHTEWVNLWNANCDSNHPRGKRELLQELDSWERTQGGKAPTANGLASTVMRKEFDGAGWANRNKDEFSRLIADAKRKKSNPATASELPKAVETREIAAPSVNGSSAAFWGDLDPSPPPQPEPIEVARPYETSEEAMSSIRQKVEAANAGVHTEPTMKAGFETPEPHANTTHPHIDGRKASVSESGVDNPALLEQNLFGLLSRDSSRDEHPANDSTGSPLDLRAHVQASSPTKKVPMFAMPEQPVTDVDDGGVGTAMQ